MTSTHDAGGPCLNLAVIGAGEWACQYHLPALKDLEQHALVRIRGIWNRTGKKAVEAASQFGIGRVYDTLDELISDDRVDCFSVLVNPRAIPGIVRELLVRKLPIFTEKSPGRTFREARELADLVDVPNVVAFNRRYMPVNQRFKEIVDDMDGIYFVECHFYRNKRLYRDFIIETGVHGINCMEYLFGEIEGVLTEKTGNPHNDTHVWVCRVRFASGLAGIMKFFPCSGSNVERYEAHSNDLSAYLFSPQTYTTDYPGRIVLHRGGNEVETFESNVDDGLIVNAGFIGEYLDFFAAIGRGTKTETVSNFKNACNTMRLAEAIERGEDL